MYNSFIGPCNPKDAFLSNGMSNEEIWGVRIVNYFILFIY